MSYLTPSNVLIVLGAIVALILIIATAAILCQVPEGKAAADNPPYEGYPEYEEGDDDEEYEGEDEDDEYDEEEEDDPFLDTVTRIQRIDWIAELEFRRMKHRAEHPLRFSDKWFEEQRKDFSLWSVELSADMADDFHEQMQVIESYAA